eukprot:CAMPEP_0194033962 /NCGR_PEP_ID=MMETSP0009_2-20130614/6418_1 /TAXON_ID=210454 /ORGANISM="Grammatophora oceanica, Strain CCMP 410" /LENGTH=299 /DNA_ID=CAMNT_0038674695 /DNA_START=80 /DNA_END=979 /DNA_ORIENTATION=+
MKSFLCFASVLLTGVATRTDAFAPSASFGRISTTVITNHQQAPPLQAQPNQKETEVFSKDNNDLAAPVKSALSTAAVWAATAQIASAAGPDWGIFEGRTGSLLHPLMMGSLLLFSLQTGFLGLQWRRQRTMGDEINALKKSLPDLGGASSVSAAIEAAKGAESVDSALVSKLEAGLETEKTIKDLGAERKELAKAGPRDKHFSQGSLLALLGTAFAIEGPLNTYARAGKLFPGPHLYAGAGLVVAWALAAACVPSMQKGSDTARTVHIGANVIGIALFVWQVTSGIPILLKVVELTKWP